MNFARCQYSKFSDASKSFIAHRADGIFHCCCSYEVKHSCKGLLFVKFPFRKPLLSLDTKGEVEGDGSVPHLSPRTFLTSLLLNEKHRISVPPQTCDNPNENYDHSSIHSYVLLEWLCKELHFIHVKQSADDHTLMAQLSSFLPSLPLAVNCSHYLLNEGNKAELTHGAGTYFI